MDYLKVEGEDGLVRDTSSQAILNTNSKGYEIYMARKNAAKTQKEELEQQRRDIADIKSDISEIMQKLSILINKQ